MSRKAAPPSLWTGTDRIRVGQRLRASLAGLLELEVLREKHAEGVRGALAGLLGGTPDDEDRWGVLKDVPGGSTKQADDHQKEPPSQEWKPTTQKPPEPGGGQIDQQEVSKLKCSLSEDTLEGKEKHHCSVETLDTDCVTKQPADDTMNAAFGFSTGRIAESSLGSRLRLGSSSVFTDHLMLGKRLTVTAEPGTTLEDPREVMDTDSRPSSGFYETSEMDSCSLSTSCTSMYSEGPQGSCWSVDSLCHLPAFSEGKSARPHSTDEAAVRLMDLRMQRLMMSNHPTRDQQRDSRRPVSTGDLDFSPLQALGALLAPGLSSLPYKCDLISRNTNEVYHYPSPLHAVALQSPLFTTSPSHEDLSATVACSPESQELLSSSQRPCSEELLRCRIDRYISKLVLQHRCRSVACGLALSRSEPGSLASHQKSLSMSSVYSSPPVVVQLRRSGSRIRRRISTCTHMRSADASAGVRDSQRSRDSVISVDTGSSTVDLPQGGPYNDGQQRNAEHASTLDPDHLTPLIPPTCRLVLVPQRSVPSTDDLYKGRHASRELVKAAVPSSERSWLSPKEVFRRLSLRKKRNSARCASEMNVSAAAISFPKHEALCRCGSRLSLTADNWKVYASARHQWTSVLEISASQDCDSPSRLRNEFCQGPAVWAVSSDCHNGTGQVVPQPSMKVRYHLCSITGLSDVDACSDCSLNSDWSIQQHVCNGTPCHASNPIDGTGPCSARSKLHRARSFKELKKMMSRSMKPFHPRGSAR
ncbi:hypothetical protein NDU88_006078 [Pleurodeles waltl]|uniref:Uncharacterized protein n=1 Tax=Pleurodeles waltl TaxID=8319 RepID=A0AAV7N2E3_PLEWA|nr:hypothetical protein NDU88_006078 [Pleurodeles waltl]